MRRLVLLLLLSAGFCSAQSVAQPETLTLAEALSLAPANDPDVSGAQNDVEAAERELARVQADPLALRVPTLQAEQNLESAEATLEAARLTSRADVTSAYFDVLSAVSALDIAGQNLNIQQATFDATQIRSDAGAATALELLQAENALAEAQRSQEDAEQTRDFALSRLSSLTGEEVEQVATVGLTASDVPTLEDSLSRAEKENSGLAAAARAAEVAEAQLAAVDNAFSAQTDIDAARDDLTSARDDLTTTRERLDLSVREAHNALASAARSFASSQATVSASREELDAQKARLDAGSLATVTYEEEALSHAQAESEMHSAFYTFRLAALTLEQTILGGAAESAEAQGGADATSGSVADEAELTDTGSDGELSGEDAAADEVPNQDELDSGDPNVGEAESATPDEVQNDSTQEMDEPTVPGEETGP